MQRRHLVTALTIAALVATACSGGDDAEEQPTDGATSSPSAGASDSPPDATAEPGGTLVVAIGQDPGHLNPAITTSGGTHTASELIYNGLLRVNADLEPEPDLAAEMPEISDDGATYTFKLRDDVVWHDGTPFTSADVKFSFDEVLLQFHSRTSASLGGALETIETPDETTVVFRFASPYAPLLQQLDVTEAPIVAKHIYEGTDPQEAEANLNPVGTGPFKFVSYQKDAEIRLEKNPDYFRDGLPLFDEVVMRVIPEDTNQVIALEAGEVDWLWGAPGPDLDRLRASGEFDFVQTSKNPGGSNCIMTVSFNLDRPVVQQQAVRAAFAHGVDRQPMLDNILFGSGRIAQAPISSGIPFAHASGVDMPDFDPAAAEALLDEAGWVREGDGVRTAQGVEGVDDGTELSINILMFPNFSRYGELMREQLAGIGIDLQVEATERGALIEKVFESRDFDTNLISYCNQSDPEIGVRRMYISDNIKPIPFSNSSGYTNAEIDRLFDEARAEVDTAVRGDLYRQIQEILVEELPYYWLVETDSTRVFPAGCEGFLAFGHFAEAAACPR